MIYQIKIMSHQPIYIYDQQPYIIYDLNNVPHICYAWQPDILYPMLQPEQCQQRVMGEIVSAVGDVVQDQVNSLENYVKKMEQDAVANTQDKIKKSTCFSCLTSR
jgi:hypothetical protein